MNEPFSWKNLKRGFTVLAPMAGITDSPFRQVCKEMGADIIFTEFVHVRGVARKDEKTLSLLKYSGKERPIIAQVFGKEPEYFEKAAKIIEELGFDGIDINMGCPARKVKEHGSGSALLSNFDLACEIVSSVRKSTKLPLSVKTRLGIDSLIAPEFIKGLAEAGAEIVTLHGRTVAQKFGGAANLDAIKETVESVDIPIIGNGDVVDLSSYEKMLATGCVGVMIGRGSLGNPWVFEFIKKNQERRISKEEIKNIILKHSEFVVNDGQSLVPFRKHLAWYVKGLDGARKIRSELVSVNNYSDIIDIVNHI